MPFWFWIFLTACVGWTLIRTSERARALSRNRTDWWIDLVNLAIHLWGLPLLQAALIIRALHGLAPGLQGRFDIGPVAAFILYALLDYLWYWNHRLLHSYTWVWNLHAVHHSATQVDIFTTARNSVWSHFFEVYIWFIAGAVYLLKDPGWFVTFVVLGSVLNFWSHMTLTFPRKSAAYRWLSKVFITPHEHLWHHSTSHSNTNYATVFSLWDRLHGTLHAPEHLPESYGNDYLPGAISQLLLPVPYLFESHSHAPASERSAATESPSPIPNFSALSESI